MSKEDVWRWEVTQGITKLGYSDWYSEQASLETWRKEVKRGVTYLGYANWMAIRAIKNFKHYEPSSKTS